ncbi:DnaA N-terminal domain-containing protein [Kiloniella laminariae]|uniref:DnaA N-terminal domain-containing protein n=1 Tax=Kiloniella laminariae TaxID=454162 RepID=UPI0003623173|nr:DnaA N-terminal domain-containing protein [Kiloniella laminariae]
MIQESCKNGIAKRGAGYIHTLMSIESYQHSETFSKARALNVICFGMPDLSFAEKTFLLTCIARLTKEQLTSGELHVWMGSTLLASFLGISQSYLRRIKASLEHKGLIARSYNHRNQPLQGKAINLVPLFARLEEFSEVGDLRFKEARERQDHLLEDRSWDELGEVIQEERAGATIGSPNRNYRTDCLKPVTGREGVWADSGEYEEKEKQSNRSKTAASERAFWRGSARGSKTRDLAKQQLVKALQVCPRWAKFVTREDIEQERHSLLLAGSVKLALSALKLDRNPEKTFAWVYEKLGWKACIALVVALEDPSVRSADRYLGYLAKCKSIDLSSNFQRISEGKDSVLPQKKSEVTGGAKTAVSGNDKTADLTGTAAKSPEMEIWQRVLKMMEQDNPVIFRSWINPLVFISLDNGVLHLRARNQFTIDQVMTLHKEWLVESLKKAGAICLDISVRKC